MSVDIGQSHCRTRGMRYEDLVAVSLQGRLDSAGWYRLDCSEPMDQSPTPTTRAFRESLELYPGFGFGVSSRIEGIYFSPDEPGRLLHVETSGSPDGKPLGGLSKSCTMHKVDSRLLMSWRVGLVAGAAVSGLLVSNYLPAPTSLAGATLLGLLDLTEVSFMLTDEKAAINAVLSSTDLRSHLSGKSRPGQPAGSR